MTNPKITICIPVYNTEEKFLRRAVENILGQTFKDFEIIIINDGSTNNAKEVIFSYEDERIKYFENEKPSGGPSKSRNIAINNAKGEYIFFHDHDDYLYGQNALEKMYSNSKQNDLDILIFEYACSDPQNEKSIETRCDYGPLQKRKDLIYKNDKDLIETVFTTPLMQIWIKCFKLQFLKNNNLFFNENLKVLDDLELYYRYIFIADKIKVLHEPLYLYYQTSSSLKTQNWPIEEAEVIKIIGNTVRNLNFFDEYKLKFLNILLFYMKNLFIQILPEKQQDYVKFANAELKKYDIGPTEIENLEKKSKDIYLYFTGAN